MTDGVSPLSWESGRLRLLDQRALPEREVWVECEDAPAVASAIRDMLVRGAPAIGVAAAYGLALAAEGAPDATLAADIEAAARLLRAARPTARNLPWAIERVLARVRALPAATPDAVRAACVEEASAIRTEDLAACRAIGRNGEPLVPPDGRILTHCNAGALATAGYGTALGIVRAVRDAGRPVRVVVPETRPYLQGARLTAWELARDGVDLVLVTDTMVGYVLARREVSCAIVGADRIAANGDTANKIGTYGIAVLCAAHGVPLYVAAPTSTVDLETPDGSAIPIEERPADEVTHFAGRRIAPAGVAVQHPAFDVTPARLIAAIITERGVARPPFTESLQRFGR